HLLDMRRMEFADGHDCVFGRLTCSVHRRPLRISPAAVWCNALFGGIPEPSWLPGHKPTQDAVDLPKMVQVVSGFQADELLDRLPSAYFVDPVALHPPSARDRLQQSQVALAQRPKDPC